ncbi:coiled-coil domain-containing protein [Enteroscipio rubneri]|uniref:Hydrolase Nlp/P60 n=2 Tax=Enteroscipio rubneri TaxID=2070686 RepID=A0A2K2UAP3_9ACTN|nr:NlpC/P60 family protein [Enteroscipio rubneri]PNV67288.1 hydrolase Nlp/P60 [Enteroscipio rubneri]
MTRNTQRTFKAFLCLTLSALLAVPLAFSSPAIAIAEPTAADKRAEADAALASLNAMQDKLDQASNNHFSALSEQQEAEDSRDAAQARIDELNGQISEMQEHLGDRARTMYRSGSSSMLDLLLGSTSFQAFATNWDMLAQINESDAEMVQQTKDLRAEVEDEKAVYEEQARVAQEKADEAKRIEEEAASTVASMQATYDSLSAEAAELLEQERAAEEAAAAAQAEAVLAAAAQAAESDNAGASGNNGSNNGGASTNNGGSSGNNNANSGGNSNGGGGSSGPSYNPSTGNAVVDRAYSQLGKPYSWGASGPNSYDCSGLVSYALTGSYSRLGTTGTFIGWPRVSNPQPGDVCVIHTSSRQHTGIYIGGGQMIHAPRTGDVVKVSSVQSGMVFVRRP